MLDTLPLLKSTISFPSITRDKIDTLQINLGYMCNQQCTHCHVNAGPKRHEIMSKEIIDDVISFVINNAIKNIDLTGGAPEMNPYFEYLIEQVAPYVDNIIDRCNLTILDEEGYEKYIDLFVKHNVEIIASLPCYTQKNVDQQRGKGVFDKSIRVIGMLNQAGYGKTESNLKLNFVYNPAGPFLPPEQVKLENEYKKLLNKYYGIKFNSLYTITNMPIKRFGSSLLSKNKFEEYMNLLKSSFNSESINSLMCRHILSVDWQGYIYDCDFNQMLNMKIMDKSSALHISNLTMDNIPSQINVAEHCYGCTAGQGSSCGGALV